VTKHAVRTHRMRRFLAATALFALFGAGCSAWGLSGGEEIAADLIDGFGAALVEDDGFAAKYADLARGSILTPTVCFRACAGPYIWGRRNPRPAESSFLGVQKPGAVPLYSRSEGLVSKGGHVNSRWRYFVGTNAG